MGQSISCIKKNSNHLIENRRINNSPVSRTKRGISIELQRASKVESSNDVSKFFNSTKKLKNKTTSTPAKSNSPRNSFKNENVKQEIPSIKIEAFVDVKEDSSSSNHQDDSQIAPTIIKPSTSSKNEPLIMKKELNDSLPKIKPEKSSKIKLSAIGIKKEPILISSDVETPVAPTRLKKLKRGNLSSLKIKTETPSNNLIKKLSKISIKNEELPVPIPRLKKNKKKSSSISESPSSLSSQICSKFIKEETPSESSKQSSKIDSPQAGYQVASTSEVIHETDVYPSTSIRTSVDSMINQPTTSKNLLPNQQLDQSSGKKKYQCSAKCSRSLGNDNKNSTRTKCQRQRRVYYYLAEDFVRGFFWLILKQKINLFRITIEFCHNGQQPERCANSKYQKSTIADELIDITRNSIRGLQNDTIMNICDKSRYTAKKIRDSITTSAIDTMNFMNVWKQPSTSYSCRRCCGGAGKNKYINNNNSSTKRDKFIFKFIQSICECDDNPLRIDDSKPAICGCTSEICDDEIQWKI